MEKTLVIDGQEVKFKSTGATPIRYKAQFQRDYFVDILKMRNIIKEENQKAEDITEQDIESFDFEVFYRIAWVLAKTADKDVPDLLTWLDSFDSFPIVDVMTDLIEIIAASVQSKKKSMSKAIPKK